MIDNQRVRLLQDENVAEDKPQAQPSQDQDIESKKEPQKTEAPPSEKQEKTESELPPLEKKDPQMPKIEDQSQIQTQKTENIEKEQKNEQTTVEKVVEKKEDQKEAVIKEVESKKVETTDSKCEIVHKESGCPYQNQRKPAKPCLAPLDMAVYAELSTKISARNTISQQEQYLIDTGYKKYGTIYNQDICYDPVYPSCCASVTLKYKPPGDEVWKWDLAEQQLWEYLNQRNLSTVIGETKHVCVDAWEIASFQRESNQAHQVGVKYYLNHTDANGDPIEAPRKETVTYEIYCDAEYQKFSNKIKLQSTINYETEVASLATVLAFKNGVAGLVLSLLMTLMYIY